MVADRTRMSFDKFMALPNDGDRHEYVRGEVRVSSIAPGWHGVAEVIVGSAIYQSLEDRAPTLGWTLDHGIKAQARLVGLVAMGEVGLEFTLPDDPRQVRGADIVYITAEQYNRLGWGDDSYFLEAPRLVVEIVSVFDRAADLDEKRRDYLAGGAQCVWIVDPLRHEIHVHDATAPTRVLHIDDILTDDDLLPGFALPLRLVFPTP